MGVDSGMVEVDGVAPMDAGEARQYVDWIKGALEDARTYLLELYEREGWRALGYTSWRACVQAEFGQGRSRVYQLLDAAAAERVLLDGPKADESTIVENIASEPIPESHLREIAPLAKAAPEAARTLWAEVQDEAAKEGVPVTAAKVREAVDGWMEEAIAPSSLPQQEMVSVDASTAEPPARKAPGPKPDPASRAGQERAAKAARKAEVLRAHAQANRTVTALERSAQALEQLAHAVEGVLEREPETMLADLLPEQAGEAARFAEQMAGWWHRAAALCTQRAGAVA